MSSPVQRLALPLLVSLAAFLPFKTLSKIILVISALTFICLPNLRVFALLAVAVVLGLTKLMQAWEKGQPTPEDEETRRD